MKRGPLREGPLIPFHGGVRATVLMCALALSGVLGCRRSNPIQPPPTREEEGRAHLQPKCVYFKTLKGYLPSSVLGFGQPKDEGSTGKYGEVEVSEVRRAFVKSEGRELSVRIVDSTMAPDLGRAIQAAAQDAKDHPSAGSPAPMVLKDAVGFVRFDPSRPDPSESRAEATLWVGGRFVVAVSSQGFPGTDEVKRVAEKLDLAGLAKLSLDGARRNP